MTREDILSCTDLPQLMGAARTIRDRAFGAIQTWSPKVFLPLTHLCRDRCHYCTFARPRDTRRAYMTRLEILEVAHQGAAAGCTEALFTLGDRPEDRYPSVGRELSELGHDSTVSYLEEACRLVFDETGLLPHVNAGILTHDEMSRLRAVSASQGLMIESVAERLCEPGGPHYRSPDKRPDVRLAMLERAGQLAIPFTTGILIGIGETREERLDALWAIRNSHLRHGHVQEVIVQNFRAKTNTPMAKAEEPSMEELLWSIAAARLILPEDVALQAPPNLSDAAFAVLVDAGINDWGGVSPVTADFVNPERPWPSIARLQEATQAAGRRLVARLPAYPAYLGAQWQAPAMRSALLAQSDSWGYARADAWRPGQPLDPATTGPSYLDHVAKPATPLPRIVSIVEKAVSGQDLDEAEITTLFSARGGDVDYVCAAANDLRKSVVGEEVTFVVNRNINYTNVCSFRCTFCAFSKGKTAEHLRGRAYDLDLQEVARRASEAVTRGATEVCMQGGIHPAYTGETYLSLLRTVRTQEPVLHVHAFSPLEIRHGAESLGLPIRDYLTQLRDAGLGSLPGTAAEILDDEVRAIICPDKLDTGEWIETIETAHAVGLRTTATIMFGHVEQPHHWSRHLIHIRELQKRTGGITEFVPLPFVAMEAPMGLRGECRMGPTWREVRLMHAVARLALHPHIRSIQTSWVKLGPLGAAACLEGGANDLGGTLMNESISRAAGADHGEEFPPQDMEALILSLGRTPRQRTTLYADVSADTIAAGRNASALAPVVQTPVGKSRMKVETDVS